MLLQLHPNEINVRLPNQETTELIALANTLGPAYADAIIEQNHRQNLIYNATLQTKEG
jgi:hypothetical protein